jgi:hypothetical protein
MNSFDNSGDQWVSAVDLNQITLSARGTAECAVDIVS